MANNSAKKNEKSIQAHRGWMQAVIYGLLLWCMGCNTAFLLSERVSVWHFLLCALVSGVTYFCYRQVLKCWELQLPSQAVEYYYDVLALNGIVLLFEPITHAVWHVYWLLLLYVLWKAGVWLWDYITPKYEPQEEEEDEEGKKTKKEKKPKVKYIK